MISKSTKLTSAIGFASFASAILFYTLNGLPMPRPILFFVFLAGSVTTLVVGGFFANSRRDWYVLSTTTIIVGYGLRLSGFLSVIASGYDHGRWMYRAKWATEVGEVLGGDMYQASPIYIIELALSNLLLGGPITSVRYVTVLIGAILPLLFFLLAYRGGSSLRFGFFSLLFAATQSFFLRTSTLMESESMALPWFILSIYFFIRSYQTTDVRYHLLFSITLITSVMLHFFYGIVIISTFAGVCVLHYSIRQIGAGKRFQADINTVWVGVLAALVLAPVWILWSTYAGTAGVTLASAFSIPAFSSITDIIVPSSGSVAQGSVSRGGGSVSRGGGSLINTLGKFYPVIIVFGIGGLGGLYAIFRSCKRYYVLILLAVTIGGATMVTIFVGLEYNLGYRMYYFVAIFAVLSAALAMDRICEVESAFQRTILVIGVSIIICSYAATAPITSLGNNVDPRFGGESWRITETNQMELEAVEHWTNEGDTVPIRIKQIHSFFSPHMKGEDIYISERCGLNPKIGETGRFVVCISSLD